ncbi:MAG: glycerate kinase [Bacteroidota bacterium]
MNILIAPDKFKGSLSALEVGRAIQKGIERYDSSVHCSIHPLADGGDDSLEILNNYLKLERIPIQVNDPLGRPILSHYYISEKAAFIELAAASGLVMLKEKEYNPLKTSTYGSGEMIVDALKRGAQKVYLFLGGSATNDAGMGIASAMGFRFLDKNEKVLSPTGENLIHVDTIDRSRLPFSVQSIEFYCLCDVQNPFCGENGASYVYAAQKGATHKMIADLDSGLNHFANVVYAQLSVEIRVVAGGGAAGGIAGGLFGLLNAKIQNGLDTIFTLSGFEEKLQQADIVISGEGKLDTQTLEGKVVSGVAQLARKYHKPLYLFVGQHELSVAQQNQLGIHRIFSILAEAKNLRDAMKNADHILSRLAEQFSREN